MNINKKLDKIMLKRWKKAIFSKGSFFKIFNIKSRKPLTENKEYDEIRMVDLCNFIDTVTKGSKPGTFYIGRMTWSRIEKLVNKKNYKVEKYRGVVKLTLKKKGKS